MKRDSDSAAGDTKLRDILSRTTAAAHAVSSARPGRVFEDLALALARILGTEAVLIAEFIDAHKQRMRTVALVCEGRLLRNVEYEVAQTPCRHIVGRESRFVPSGVNAEFAPGTLFAAKGFDAYAGYAVLDSAGAQIGNIVALDRKPIADRELTEALLRIFATRAGAEFDRLRIEAAWHASETSYRAIFDAAEDAIFVHDWDTGRILDVNPKACRAYGWPREEMLACGVEDLSSNVPPYTAEDASGHLEAARRGASVRFEWHRRNRDGSLHWDEVVLKPATIDGVPRILAFTREITERKAALEALQQREEQYRAIFNASADALVLWNKDVEIVDVNPAFLRIYGFAREDIVGRGYPSHLPGDYVDERLQMIRRALAGEACDLQTRAYRADGTPFDVELRVIPIRHRGEPHVLAIARDITERKRAEEQLRASEARYRLLFETESDAILLVDADSLRLIDANPAAERMYGYAREELLALTARDLSTDPEQTQTAIQQPVGAVSVPLRWHRRRDGRVFPVEINANRLQLDGRKTVVAAIRDITERMHAEEALRASEAQYRSIFNASLDAMVLRDAELKLVDANAAFLARHGVTREDVIGTAGMMFITPSSAAAVEALLRAALAGRGGTVEAQTIAHGEVVLDIEVRAVPMQYDGRPHVLSIARDITERKRAEQALRASEEQYRAIFNASADAMMLWDRSLRRVDVNPAHEKIFGFKREEVVGRAFEGLPYPEEYVRPRMTMLKRALAGEASRAELGAARKDGTRIVTELRTIPFVHRGEPHVLQIARDITERNRAEHALRASEEQYRAVFNASADALVLRDAAFRIVDVNDTYERMSGYARAEVLGVDRVLANPPETRDRIRELHDRALAGETVVLETQIVRHDGASRELELRAMPVRHRGEPHVLWIGRDITERKRSEEALRASEQQYRAIFAATVDGLLLWDEEHRVVDVNDAFLAMLGFAREEVVGLVEPSFIPEDLRSQCVNLLSGVLDGSPCQLEGRARRKDATEFDVEIRGMAMRYKGRPHALVTLRDVTERRRAEVRLRASEEQYRSIFEVATDALQLLDAQGRVVDVNPAYERMYGRRRADVVGKSIEDLVPERFRAERVALVQRALAGEAVEVQTTGYRDDGTTFDLEVRTIPFRHRGQPHVLGIARDITERRAREEALRASEEQYRTIFNASADALVLWDSNCKRVDVNPAYERIFGWTRDEVVGSDYHERNVPPEYAARRLDLVRRALAGELCHAEMESIRKDGERFRAEIHVIPIQYRGAPHALAIVRDVTERWRAQQQRALLEAQLRQAQKMEAIGQLTGGIAHDFNNILASVMGYLVLAEERSTDAGDDKSVHYLTEAQASCRRARDLIQQMLTFSRGGRGEPRAVSLAALVKDALPMLRSVLPSTLAIGIDCDDEVPAVLVDELQAHQVLLNLAINARDAMGGIGRLRVAVARRAVTDLACTSCRHEVSGLHVELAVTDTGSGIAPELLERIFDPFFTTKEPGKGTGMGLSVVHGIVHEHDGHIVVDTAPGAGSTFRVLWPVRPESASVRAPAKNDRRRRPTLTGRVLLVDDEPAVLAPIRELLANWGLEVTAVAAPADAQAIYADDPGAFDVLITDHAMPLASGLELATRLRAITPDLRWLLCTGYADEATVARAEEEGAVAVLRKPVEPGELRAAVERCLAASR